MDLGIAGRTALVWGGNRGLGRACAESLAAAGVTVTIAARTEATLRDAAEQIGRGMRWVVADITTDAGRRVALGACPSPDILVNNAVGPAPGDFRTWTREDWIASLDALMLGPIEMIRLVVDGMCERQFGRIINISARSVRHPQLELGLSNGPRSGLVGFVAGLARQTVRHNVTINTLLPGIFDSDAQYRHIEGMVATTGKSAEQLWKDRVGANPSGRAGRPEELGAWCAFLASSHAGYSTGLSILVDGGGYPGVF